jgi:hypothetical protein
MFSRCLTIHRRRHRRALSPANSPPTPPRLSSAAAPQQISFVPFVTHGMEPNGSTQTRKANPSPLCLKCRKAGHIVAKCASRRWPRDEFTWFFSEARRAMEIGNPSEMSEQKLCQRCQDLNILQLLQEELPWKSTSALNKRALKGSEKFRSLGKTGSIEFWNDCPLCLCLFALTPNPSSPTQDVLILPDWTMNRVAGETDTVTDMEGWRQFPKCLLVTLSDGSSNLGFSTKVHRGDALCVIEEDDPDYSLGGRLITSDHLSIKIIEDWLSSCSKLHSAKCRPTWTQELPDIKLVDVSTREIVQPPEGPFDYLALSYVWGEVNQQSYQLGSKLATVPQTIEDAIYLVQKLGKRYLWVDSLCIDQADDKDKERQIMKMQNIYCGAYVTIIALSGKSANAGLPRLNHNKDVYPQLTCRIDKKRLVGLMPTLSQQIWRAAWGTRAWTLQEALLSPRCLYISDHQLYFECNGMQCCESLNDTRSWAHHLRLESNQVQGGWLASKVGDGCLRTPIDNPTHRMERYGSKLTLYSYRSMKKDADGLNAFSGVLQFLETMYTEGFYVGVPIEDFQWGLLWRSQWPPTPRPGFPTWSWAAWQGGLWAALPFDFTRPHQYPIHLRMWRDMKGRLVQFFGSSQLDLFPKDPVAKAAWLDPRGPEFDLLEYPHAEKDSYLFIEAIMLQFIPDYSTPSHHVPQSGQYSVFIFSLRGSRCGIRIISVDPEVNKHPRREKQQFLLLARDYSKGLVFHHLLLVHFRGGVAVRGTVLELVIPERHLEALEELHPQKRRIVLA